MKVFIASFENEGPAESLRNRLSGDGIHARLVDDSALQSLLFWTKPAATKRVYVDPADFDRARGLVEEWDKAGQLPTGVIRCPECRSLRVDFPQYTRKFLTPLVVELLVSLGLAEKDYYCRDCHYTWPKKFKPKPELDPLGFPKRGP